MIFDIRKSFGKILGYLKIGELGIKIVVSGATSGSRNPRVGDEERRSLWGEVV
jgi:hypothetical protein